MAARVQRLAAITAIVVGVGVAAAPAAFQMFTRAPEGGVMMDEFEPYMSAEVIGEFRGYLATIDAATGEMPQLRSDVADPAFDTTYVSAAQLQTQWPTVQADMTELPSTHLLRMVLTHSASASAFTSKAFTLFFSSNATVAPMCSAPSTVMSVWFTVTTACWPGAGITNRFGNPWVIIP